MATTSRLPNGESATNAKEQFPNCIIASSDRYADLKPFCDNIYSSDQAKWGCILPWEFPQNGTREVEEMFIRKFFTEVEIHMQGGAHGAAAGFRFLKQAWYSIAMWNLYERIPAIAEWWMKENVVLLDDPAMREPLCEPEAIPETFFRPHEIQQYGKKLLTLVVTVIQSQVEARHEQPFQRTPDAEAQQLAADDTAVSDGGKAEVRPTAVVVPESQDYPAATTTNKPRPITSATVPTDPDATPFSSYHGATSQRGSHREFRDFTPSYDQHTQQINGRKRNNQYGNNSGTRFPSNDRRQRDNHQHHHFVPNFHQTQGGFGLLTPSFVESGTIDAATSGNPLSPYVAQPGQPYRTQGFHAPQQQVLGPYPSSSGSAPQDMLAYTALNNTPRQQFSQPRHFTHNSDNDRYSSNRARNTSFNEVSNTSGDARRSSFGSRGGTIRGQYRGVRGRGGRSRDSVHESAQSFEEQALIRKTSNESYANAGYSHTKRHSSAYQGNTWRSTSEHPQVENVLPHRVLSGPDQYPSFQDYHGPTGSRLLPPFTFPHGPATTHQGQISHRPLQANMFQTQPASPDLEVGKTYIGADASHVDQLVAFNIPADASPSDVAQTFAHTCDVDVADVRFPLSQSKLHPGTTEKIAFIQFQNHHVARRVLDLREVDLYGRPLRIEVPRHYFQENFPHFAKPPITARRNQGSYGVTPGDANLWVHEPANISAPPSQHNQMRAAASFIQSSEASSSYASYPPSTPFHPARGEQSLSTVQSVNTTPVNSGPNTPKKTPGKNKKNKKKNRDKTPLTSDLEGKSAIAPDRTTAQETPVKPPKQSRHDRSAAVSNDLPLAPNEVQALEILSKTKDATVKPIQAPKKSNGKDDDDDAAAASSPTVFETPAKPQEAKNPSRKGPMASRNVLVTESTSIPNTPSTAEPTVPSPGSPAAEPTSGHSQVCRSEVGSDITPKVSPRSQNPVQQSKETDKTPDHAEVPSSSEKHSLAPQSSPPPNGSIRPDFVDRRISDSDHVDESFHTASGSPPGDKQVQSKGVAMHSEQPTRLVNITSDSVGPVSPKNGKSATPITSNGSPKAETSTSIQELGASNNKTSSESYFKEDKPQSPTPQRVVTNDSDIAKAGDCRNETPALSTTTKAPRVLPAIQSSEQTPPRNNTVSDSRSEEKVAESQRVVSTSSVPPKSAAADHKARTTPATSQVSAPPYSPGNSSSKSKAQGKKGPSQTESLSMFGKKQQKQKKSTKGKGTLKGKPLDSGSISGPSSDISSRDLSGVTTPASTANESTDKKESALSVTTRADSRTKAGSNSDGTKSTVSRQQSPGKGGILESLGNLSMVGSFFSMASSPSASGHETMPQDAVSDEELICSKAPVVTAPTTPSIEGDAIDNSSTPSDLGGRHDSEMPGNTRVDSLSISISGSSDSRGTRKKNRERNNKQKKQVMEPKGGSSDASTKEDGEGDYVASSSASGALEDTTSESYGLESDNHSDRSSVTAGGPTPPDTPKRLSSSTRKHIENRMKEIEHIITPPAPRNQHIKKKSYSRSASSTNGISTQEATLPPATPATEREIQQQNRLLRLYQIANSDEDEDGSQQSRPRVLILTRSGESEVNPRYPLTGDDEGGRYKLIQLGQGGDDENKDVILTSEGLTMMSSTGGLEMESTEGPTGRISEVDSEDDSTK